MRLQLVFKILNNQLCPTQLHNYMTLRSECRGRILRDRREIHLPRVKSTIGQSTFKFTEVEDWNELPNELRVDGLTLDLLKERHLSICKNKTNTS